MRPLAVASQSPNAPGFKVTSDSNGWWLMDKGLKHIWKTTPLLALPKAPSILPSEVPASLPVTWKLSRIESSSAREKDAIHIFHNKTSSENTQISCKFKKRHESIHSSPILIVHAWLQQHILGAPKKGFLTWIPWSWGVFHGFFFSIPSGLLKLETTHGMSNYEETKGPGPQQLAAQLEKYHRRTSVQNHIVPTPI